MMIPQGPGAGTPAPSQVPQSAPQEGVPQGAQAEYGETMNLLIEVLLSMWRRAGEVLGQPISDEGEALQMATQAAMSQMQQVQAAQSGHSGMPQNTPPENPLVAALRGGGGGF